MSEVEGAVVGIDVSKNKVNVCCLPQDDCFEVEAKNYGKLVEKLVSLQPRLVVMEATGGYERALFSKLANAGLEVAVVNPKRVRDFAKADSIAAKTDALDARVIAKFGQVMNPRPTQYAGDESEEIRDILARRHQLVEMRTRELNRKQQAVSREIVKSLAKTIRFFDKLIAGLDRKLDQRIKASPEMREREEILKSVPGVGDQTARTIMMELSEIGTLSRTQIAALVGVAPMNRDSGKRQGTRFITGGRAAVRTALYMACITAIRRNPRIRQVYRHLRDSGKKAKVAIVACMRKLLVCLNTMVRNKEKFNPDLC